MLPNLVDDGPTQFHHVTLRLQALGRSTLVQEVATTRAGLWVPARSKRATQLALLYEPRIVYGQPFEQFAGRALTGSHQRLWGELITEYLRAGQLDRRRGGVPVRHLGKSLGYEMRKDGELTSDSLRHLKNMVDHLSVAQFRGAIRLVEEGKPLRVYTNESDELTIQLIDSPDWRDGPDRTPWLYYGIPMGVASLIHNVQHLTFLNGSVWDALRADDELAAMAWVVWEGERIPEEHGFRFPVFAGADEKFRDERYDPCIAEVLHLRYSDRREAVRRVREIVRAVIRHDTRYTGTEVVNGRAGAWYVHVRRAAHSPKRLSTAEPRATGLAPEILRAFRFAHGGRMPSKGQREVLVEVGARRGAEWLEAALRTHADLPNPFGEVMQLDQRISKGRQDKADAAEASAGETKIEEIEAAPRILEMIGRRVRSQSDAVQAPGATEVGPTGLGALISSAFTQE